MNRTAPSRECNRPGCTVRIVLAMRVDNHKWVPYEAEPREGDAMAGCHVLVGDQAWNPPALAEHFRVRFEIPSPEKARELVSEYPHHRPHFHLTDEGVPT